ncbi:hypothetical protein M1437_03230, partial [Patescibacteria group bacterium]|nr:hypothetical protein [Patescibacteria group bacterium]
MVGGPVGGAIGGGVGQAGGRMLELGQEGKNPMMNIPEPLRGILGAIIPGGNALNMASKMGANQPYSSQDFGSVGSEGSQGSIYGAVPGSIFGKKALEWTVGKPLAGAVVGGGTQAIRNIQQGDPLGKDVLSQAGLTGALNTIIPGASK